MAHNSQQLAGEVVNAFRELLGEEICGGIGDERFHDLHAMVCDVLAEQSAVILERFEEDLRQLRSELVERRPLEL
jgi:hypothetical protein